MWLRLEGHESDLVIIFILGSGFYQIVRLKANFTKPHSKYFKLQSCAIMRPEQTLGRMGGGRAWDIGGTREEKKRSMPPCSLP